VGYTGDRAEQVIKGLQTVKRPLNEDNAGFASCLAWFGALEEGNSAHEKGENLGATRAMLSQVQQQ